MNGQAHTLYFCQKLLSLLYTLIYSIVIHKKEIKGVFYIFIKTYRIHYIQPYYVSTFK